MAQFRVQLCCLRPPSWPSMTLSLFRLPSSIFHLPCRRPRGPQQNKRAHGLTNSISRNIANHCPRIWQSCDAVGHHHYRYTPARHGRFTSQRPRPSLTHSQPLLSRPPCLFILQCATPARAFRPCAESIEAARAIRENKCDQ